MLLNSNTFKTWFGSLSKPLSNIVDHAPNSTIWNILRNGKAQIEAKANERDQFVAAFSLFPETMSDEIATIGSASSRVSSKTWNMLDPETLKTSMISYTATSFTRRGARLRYIFENFSSAAHLTSVSILGVAFQCAYEKVGNQYVSITLTPVLPWGSIPSFQFKISANIPQYSFSGPKFLFGRTSLILPEVMIPAPIALAAVAKALSPTAGTRPETRLFPLCVGDYSSSYTGLVTENADWVESFKTCLLTGYGEENTDNVTFTNAEGRAFAATVVKDYDDSIGWLCWNGDLSHPWVLLPDEQTGVIINAIYDVSQSVSTLPSLIADLSVSNDINAFLCNMIDLASSTSAEKADEVAQIIESSYTGSKQQLNNLKSQATTAFIRGGFYGLAVWITGFFTTTTSTSTSSSGLTLEFTDNTNWVPTDYICGILSILGDALSTIGTAIIAFGSKIIGAIITITGLLAKAITQLVNGAYDNARYQIIDDRKTLGLASPYAMLCGENDLRDIDETLLPGFSETLKIPFYFQVLGGYLLVGASKYNNRGEPTKYKWEFHPALVDYTNVVYGSIFSHEQTMSLLASGHYDSGAYHSIYTSESTRVSFSVACRDRLQLSAVKSAIQSAGCPDFYDASDGYIASGHTHDVTRLLWLNTALFIIQGGLLERMSGDTTTTLKEEGYSATNTSVISFNGGDWDNTISGSPTLPSKIDLVDAVLCGLCAWDAENFYPNCGTFFGSSFTVIGNSITDSDDFSGDPMSTRGIAQFCIISNNYTLSNIHWYLPSITINDDYCFCNMSLPSEYKWFIKPPKYTESSIISAIALSITVTALVAGISIAATLKTKRAIADSRAMRNARVEQAWETLAEDPSPQNAKNYTKAARKNNLASKFFGGQTYDTAGYWVDSSEQISPFSALSSIAVEESSNVGETSVSTETNFGSIITLIKG